MKSFRYLHYLALVAAFSICGSLSAAAQETVVSTQQDLLPAGTTVSTDAQLEPGEETHPPLRLTPDKSEILSFDEDIERVIVGADHINILMDTARRLIVVPRMPGTTHFTLLGKDGKIVMQRHAIVASPQAKYIRLRQPCNGRDTCIPIRMFYCPGMCHEMGIVGEGGSTFSGSIAADAPATPSTDAAEEIVGGEDTDNDSEDSGEN